MNSSALFPFGITEGRDRIGVDAFGSLMTGIHLDRTRARRLGWRGVRQTMSQGYAWTMRLAERPGVYGLAFLDESADNATVISRFAMLYFPDPEESVLAGYRPQVRAEVTRPDFLERVRDFPARLDCEEFFLGQVTLGLRLDLAGLRLDAEARARQRVLLLGTDEGMPDAWICDIPSLFLTMPLVRLLAQSAALMLQTQPAWSVARSRYPLPAIDQDGERGAVKNAREPGLVIRAAFGEAVPDRRLKPLRRNNWAYGRGKTAFRPVAGKAFAVRERSSEEERPVVHVISGFLGSGKTTFLSGWLAWLHNHDRHTAVLQNELGAANLDASLLAHETLSEPLDEGCVCCTLADSLRPGIRRLLDVLPTDQIILETTGLANPGAVREALRDLDDLVRPGLVITLVDGLETARSLESEGVSGLALEQIRGADVLILNKLDLLDTHRLQQVSSHVSRQNPDAVIIQAAYGRIAYGELDRLADRLCGRMPDAVPKASGTGREDRLTHADEGFETLLIRPTRPLSRTDLAQLVGLVGDRVPRIKGVVDSAEDGRPLVVQYAAGLLDLEKPSFMPGERRFLVLIGKDLDATLKEKLACLSGLSLTVDEAAVQAS